MPALWKSCPQCVFLRRQGPAGYRMMKFWLCPVVTVLWTSPGCVHALKAPSMDSDRNLPQNEGLGREEEHFKPSANIAFGLAVCIYPEWELLDNLKYFDSKSLVCNCRNFKSSYLRLLMLHFHCKPLSKRQEVLGHWMNSRIEMGWDNQTERPNMITLDIDKW